MTYNIVPKPILDVPFDRIRIGELKVVHPTIREFLSSEGYEVYNEKAAFRLRHYSQTLALRVDFLAFKGNEIVIIECKGSPFSEKKVLAALLQISIYMRVYKMMREIRSPQLSLLDDFDPTLLRGGDLRGVLAIPYFALSSVLEDASEHLAQVNLSEDDIEVWNLRSSFSPGRRL